MEALFLRLLNMSLSAGAVIVLVLLARLCLRRAPKKWSYLLWAAPAFRLLCPVSFRAFFSVFRLRPPARGIAPAPALTFLSPPEAAPAVVSGAGTAAVPSAPAPLPAAAQGSGVSLLNIAIVLWCLGAAAMAIYAFVSWRRMEERLSDAVRLEGDLYETDRIDSPFLLGLWHPRIYLPAGLRGERLRYVLSHERVHLRRGDHWVKLLAFCILSLHWFNPLVWLAFFLLNRDMEMSCDERVLEETGDAGEYSRSLLSFAAPRRFPLGPLAFGETDGKKRIRNALRWKKPRTWVTLAALLLVIAVTAACAANPPKEATVEETVRGNMKTYSKMSDGSWSWEGHSYAKRLEIRGRMPDAAADSTFVYLSNRPITFEQAWKAAGFSSSLEDYFSPEEAVLVEWRTGEDPGSAGEQGPALPGFSAIIPDGPAAEGNSELLSLLAALKPENIHYIYASGLPVLTPENLAPALNRASRSVLERAPEPEDLYLLWSADIFLSGGPESISSRDEQLWLQAGLTENLLRIRYKDEEGELREAWLEDEGLYRLLRDPRRWEGSIDPAAWEKYGCLLEWRAQAVVENYAPYPEDRSRFTGYEITRLEKTDYRYVEGGRLYDVYAWDVAFTVEDPRRVAWAGGMELDGKERVVNYELDRYLAVYDTGGEMISRFLGWDSFLEREELNTDLWEPTSRSCREQTLLFPTTEGRETLEVRLLLPEGWQLLSLEREAAREKGILYLYSNLEEPMYLFDERGVCVGALGCSAYTEVEGAEEDPRAIYGQIALGNGWRFDVREKYDVLNDAGAGETARTEVYSSAAFLRPYVENAEEKRNEGILRYDRALGCFAALELEPGALSEEELDNLARTLFLGSPWPRNEAGETYGYIREGRGGELVCPDLSRVDGTAILLPDGSRDPDTVGYIRESENDPYMGLRPPASAEDALRYDEELLALARQALAEGRDYVYAIPVYLEDGVTVIGKYGIGQPENVVRQLGEEEP